MLPLAKKYINALRPTAVYIFPSGNKYFVAFCEQCLATDAGIVLGGVDMRRVQGHWFIVGKREKKLLKSALQLGSKAASVAETSRLITATARQYGVRLFTSAQLEEYGRAGDQKAEESVRQFGSVRRDLNKAYRAFRLAENAAGRKAPGYDEWMRQKMGDALIDAADIVREAK